MHEKVLVSDKIFFQNLAARGFDFTSALDDFELEIAGRRGFVPLDLEGAINLVRVLERCIVEHPPKWRVVPEVLLAVLTGGGLVEASDVGDASNERARVRYVNEFFEEIQARKEFVDLIQVPLELKSVPGEPRYALVEARK